LYFYIEIGERYDEEEDLKYHDDFYKKYKGFADYPEIAKSNSSEDFFTDNLCSQFFQWVEVHESPQRSVYINRYHSL